MQQLRPGTKLRQYRVLKVLGSGGFSIVYLAQDETLNKPFAIKEYFPKQFAHRRGNTIRASGGEAGDFTWGKTNFIEEARRLAQFDHPNIVKVIQIFEANNTAYMVLQYLGGRDFKSWLAEIESAPRQKELDHVVEPILDALEVVHRNEKLHRDVAPDNIYICDDGKPVLLDFGSAKEALGQRTKTISAVVKDGYSPPELYSTRGTGQGPWSDIYGFAATLYYAVSGARPEEAPDRVLADNYVPAREAAKSEYRPAFLDALDWGLRVAPKDRPQSITEWRTALFRTEGLVEIPAPKVAPIALENLGSTPEIDQTISSRRAVARRANPLWFGVLLGLMAIISGLLSAYATLDPWGVLQTTFGAKVPLLPAFYFAGVLCAGLYAWETKKLQDLVVVSGAVVIAWICAVESSVAAITAVDGLGGTFAHQYSSAIGGAVGGFVGSSLTTLGLCFCAKELRNRAAILAIVLLGTLAGPMLQIDTNGPRILFLVWQPLIATAVGYLLVAPKLHRGVPIQIPSKTVAAILVGLLAISAIGAGFRQARLENQAYADSSDSDVLQAYLASCWICQHRSEVQKRLDSLTAQRHHDEQVVKEESQFERARGDESRLRIYADGCQICAHKTQALNEIVAIQLRRRKEAREQAEYNEARGNLDRLQRYVRDCEVCAYKGAAQNEITKLLAEVSKPPAQGGPLITGAEVMQQRATTLLKTVYSADSADLLRKMPDIYASEVAYFGKTLLRDEVIAQVTRFTERWPQRLYVPRETSLNIQCNDATLVCTAAGVLDFEASNVIRKERSKGVATFEFTLKYTSPTSSPKIIRENGNVLERQIQPLR